MPLDFLRETFDMLNKLNEEAFELTDDGIDELKDFEDENEDEIDTTVDVIDTNAETDEEAKSSAHVGQVICECGVCHSNIFFDKDKIEYNVETELCNEDEECPYCGETGGFTLVGEIAEYKPEEKEEKEEKKTEEEETSELDDEVEEGEEAEKVEESLHDDSFDEKCDGKDCEKKDESVLAAAAAPFVASVASELGKEVVDRIVGEDIEQSSEDVEETEDEAYHSKHLCKDGECEEKEVKECNESIENITFEANGNTVTADDEKITIESKQSEEPSTEEVVEPVSEETAEEIVTNSEEEEIPEEEAEEPAEEEEETEVDVDEIQEESFNKLGTSFLKKTYENVQSFRTTSVKANDTKMVLEGIITFKSGSKKKTAFVFESVATKKDGVIKFFGENKDIARGSRAFLFEGRVSDKQLIAESLRYNYRAKTPAGKSVRVSGTIRNDK